MTNEELIQLIAGLALAQQRTDRQIQATDRLLREADAETDRQLRTLREETDRLAKQMGELGNKFGSFTEGMAFPSMRKLLMERFGADFVTLRPKKKMDGRTLEVDVLAVSNSKRNAAYVVEVKSHLKLDGVDQMLRILRDFPQFYPEQSDKQLYGVLALVDASDEVRQYALKHGLYLAEISGDTFKLCVPEDFVPRSFRVPAGPPPPGTVPPASQPSA